MPPFTSFQEARTDNAAATNGSARTFERENLFTPARRNLEDAHSPS
jgi:hypothetical protein